MRKVILILLFTISLTNLIEAQVVNGEIFLNENNLTVVKVWGTHEERGYAVGYLLAEQIVDMYQNFIVPSFGSLLPFARTLIKDPAHYTIQNEYVVEATAMVNGIVDAGFSLNIDYSDILVSNSFLDIANLSSVNLNLANGCSSLMSWGRATEGTDITGKSVISRHMDWNVYPAIIRNQVMVVHVPQEEDEQPWLLVGFAGQMSVLSGVNESGLSVMQHMLADDYSNGSLYKAYEPIWFSLRRSIEKRDVNGDGKNDVADAVSVVQGNTNGYADSYIVASLASSAAGSDSLIAMVAEVAPSVPYSSIRYNTYPDSIPGDNLYAANFSISRNNAMHFCMRYDSIRANIDDGERIGSLDSWNLMLNHSSTCAFGGPGNIQFMQYIPDNHTLKLAVHLNDGTQACQNTPFVFSTIELFQINPTQCKPFFQIPLSIIPNPARANSLIRVILPQRRNYELRIFSIQGIYIKRVITKTNELEINGLTKGVYIVTLFEEGVMKARERLVVWD